MKNLKESAYEQLKRKIISGEMKVGEFYFERQLATEMGISRSPIREAIASLIHEKYMSSYPSKGVCVYMLSKDEAHEYWQLIASMEQLCIRYIMINVMQEPVEKLLRELEMSTSEISVENSPTEIFAFYYGFLMTLISYINNKEIREKVDMYLMQLKRFLLKIFEDSVEVSFLLEELQTILEFMKKEDEKETIAAFLNHITHIDRACLTVM